MSDSHLKVAANTNAVAELLSKAVPEKSDKGAVSGFLSLLNAGVKTSSVSAQDFATKDSKPKDSKPTVSESLF
jgi:hypothetical protein